MTNANNVLLHIHTLLSKLPVTLRERICEECNWSTPTFYRKIRSDAAKDLSNAEKEMIATIINEVVDELNEAMKYPPFVAETPQLT